MPNELAMFFDPWSLPLVLLGSLVIAWIQNGTAAMCNAVTIIPSIFSRHRNNAHYKARLAMIRVEERVAKNGPNHADRIAPDTHFIASLAEILANAPDKKNYARSVADYRAHTAQQHNAAYEYWRDITELSPAIGMIGTVIGLILMFDNVHSANAIGEAMAICLLTSLYGLLLAHIVAGPITRRIEFFIKNEMVLHDELTRRFDVLARDHLHNRSVILSISAKGASDGRAQLLKREEQEYGKNRETIKT